MGSRHVLGFAAAAAMLVAAAGVAHADGYPPFYGYSPYFGQTTTYFTPDDTIHQVTKPLNGEYGFGTRTYYRGGPFWTYQPNIRRAADARARQVVLRSRY